MLLKLGGTSSLNYARSGLVDWKLAAVFLVGGVAGGLLGGSLAVRLAARKGMLNLVFSGLIFVVAIYMLYQSAGALGFI